MCLNVRYLFNQYFKVLVPRQSLQISTFSCLSTQQEHILTKFRSNYNIQNNCNLHVSSQLLDKQYYSDPFANIKDCDNLSLNPTLHQKKVSTSRLGLAIRIRKRINPLINGSESAIWMAMECGLGLLIFKTKFLFICPAIL